MPTLLNHYMAGSSKGCVLRQGMPMVCNVAQAKQATTATGLAMQWGPGRAATSNHQGAKFADTNPTYCEPQQPVTHVCKHCVREPHPSQHGQQLRHLVWLSVKVCAPRYTPRQQRPLLLQMGFAAAL
jgi:hypothetical protein